MRIQDNRESEVSSEKSPQQSLEHKIMITRQLVASAGRGYREFFEKNIKSYSDRIGLTSSSQFGFRSGKFTEDALRTLIEIIYIAAITC